MKVDSNSDVVSLLASRGHFSLVLSIFEQLDGFDLKQAQLVSKTWRDFVLELWRHHEHKRLRDAWQRGTPKMAEIRCSKRRSVCTVSSMAVDEADVALALGGSGDIEVWQRRFTSRRWAQREAHKDGVYAIAMCADFVASGGDDNNVKLWVRANGELAHVLQHHEFIVWAVGIWNNTLFSAAYDCSIAFLDITKNDDVVPIKTISGPREGRTSWADAVALDPKGHRLATTVDEEAKSYEIYVWNLDEAVKGKEDAYEMTKPSYELSGHRDVVRCVKFAGELIASGGNDRRVIIWKDRSQLRLFEGMKNTIWCLDVDKKRLVAGGRFGQLRVWNMEREEDYRDLSYHDESTAIGQVYLDGKTGLISTDGLGIVKLADFWHLK